MSKTSERIEGTEDDPLPNGGAYAIVYYQDVDGTPVPKEAALKIEVHEFDASDKPLQITFIDLTAVEDSPE